LSARTVLFLHELFFSYTIYYMLFSYIQGEHSPPGPNGEFDISNKYRIGYSEVELMQSMIDGVDKVSSWIHTSAVSNAVLNTVANR
jgi:ABC-type anion transport system duplicated permease subunit